ncbi:MAG: fumarylacetoacetate hydrolase family protein [Pseudomonadales bacterium]
MWYALARYDAGGTARSALVLGEQLYDLEQNWERVFPDSGKPKWLGSVDLCIAHWHESSTELSALARAAQTAVTEGKLVAVEGGQDKLLAPLSPARVFCTASNYIEHAAEMNTILAAKSDSSPYVFIKAGSSVIGPNATVLIPPETEKPDWEVELGVVIGKTGRRIKAEDAQEYIAGYTVVNDISARDMNRRTDYPFKHDWFRGKSWDTFCPMGPWFVPATCISDLHQLKLQLSLNGELKQDGNTSELIWNAYEQIEYLSSILTLQPGDVIATGTPAGVGMGEGIFLKPGDVMVASVEGVGSIRNPVAAEEISC